MTNPDPEPDPDLDTDGTPADASDRDNLLEEADTAYVDDAPADAPLDPTAQPTGVIEVGQELP
ncbi:MAG: hypothetical protein ACRCZP_11660 [Phycicoccus sp.]